MNICAYIILIIIILILSLKLNILKNSIKEIKNSLHKILKIDTNNLITISSDNEDMRELANSLNSELKILREQKLQYENGNQELKKLLTNISHDLRTPLTAIKAYTDLLKENKNKEYIEIIERKTNELIIQTEQLLYFSKMIDIKTQIDKENICINDLLENTLVSYYAIFKEKNINLEINITQEKIFKKIDKNTIIRVFENIISNAIKHGDGNLEITLDKEGKMIFANKASSLDVTTVNKIFDRYYTVENAKKSTGIGLSIAKQLVELNEAKIIAEYNKNKLSIIIDFS